MGNMGVWEYHVSIAATIIVMLVCSNGIAEVQSQSQNVPAFFVFGDSLVDVGNNNYLLTYAKANYFPYGIDFVGGHTGRFSNGKLIIDFLGEKLGVPSPQPFAKLRNVGYRMLTGVNYASAGSGILDESGRAYGKVYSMNQQVLNFENTLSQYRTMMNETTLNQFLVKSIAVVVTGTNDYMANYLWPGFYSSHSNYTDEHYANLLVNRLEQQISRLHSLGLRKFFVAGTGPIGCMPYIRRKFFAPPKGCVENVNERVRTFNEGLRSMVDQLKKNHPDAVFAYGNTYRVLGEIIDNPANHGFVFNNTACCGIGRYRGLLACLPFQLPCARREEFVYWDAFHPSEAASYIFAARAFRGDPDYAYPINLQQMALM